MRLRGKHKVKRKRLIIQERGENLQESIGIMKAEIQSTGGPIRLKRKSKVILF